MTSDVNNRKTNECITMRDKNVCRDSKLKQNIYSRFLQINCNEINLVFNQIAIFFVCFTIHGEDRGLRSVKNRKHFFSLNFWLHFVGRAGRNVFARVLVNQ